MERRKINFGKVEKLIKEMYYNQKGHEVGVENVLERKNGTIEVEYKYFINGVYQSTHEVELTNEQTSKCKD